MINLNLKHNVLAKRLTFSFFNIKFQFMDLSPIHTNVIAFKNGICKNEVS